MDGVSQRLFDVLSRKMGICSENVVPAGAGRHKFQNELNTDSRPLNARFPAKNIRIANDVCKHGSTSYSTNYTTPRIARHWTSGVDKLLLRYGITLALEYFDIFWIQ
jgi:hypothetical protein